MSDLGQILSRMGKNKNETAVIRLVEFHGHLCCDLRVFLESDEGGLFPKKKGVALNVSLIPDIIAALKEAKAEADKWFARAY